PTGDTGMTIPAVMSPVRRAPTALDSSHLGSGKRPMRLGLARRLRYHPSPIDGFIPELLAPRSMRRASPNDLTLTYNAAEYPRTNYWRLGYRLSCADGHSIRLLRNQRRLHRR